MVIYWSILSVKVEQIQENDPIFLYSCYADDFRNSGADPHLKATISCIELLRPVCGFFLKLEKSKFVRGSGISEELYRVATAPLDFSHWRGAAVRGVCRVLQGYTQMVGLEGVSL